MNAVVVMLAMVVRPKKNPLLMAYDMTVVCVTCLLLLRMSWWRCSWCMACLLLMCVLFMVYDMNGVVAVVVWLQAEEVPPVHAV